MATSIFPGKLAMTRSLCPSAERRGKDPADVADQLFIAKRYCGREWGIHNFVYCGEQPWFNIGWCWCQLDHVGFGSSGTWHLRFFSPWLVGLVLRLVGVEYMLWWHTLISLSGYDWQPYEEIRLQLMQLWWHGKKIKCVEVKSYVTDKANTAA